MAMTFLTLTGPKSEPGSIHNFVNYRRVPVEVVLEEAQAFIYSRLRVREMKASAVITLTANASSVALPTGFLEPIAMRDREGWEMIPDRYVEPPELIRHRVYTNDVLETGTPGRVAIFDELFQFECKAEAQHKYDLAYYKTPALLSATNVSNFLTARYPHIVRIACMAGAASYMKDDEEESKQLAKLTGLCDAANAESDLSRAS